MFVAQLHGALTGGGALDNIETHPLTLVQERGDRNKDRILLLTGIQAALRENSEWLRTASLKDPAENFARFRIESTGEQVRLISEKVRSRGKKLSCAVFDDYSGRAVRERLQPWLEWLEEGLIDSAVVMAYGREPDEVISRVENIRNIHGSLKGIRVGLGAFNYAGRWDDFIGLVKSVRKMDPDEITFFALSSIDKELAGKLKALG
jgi:uncharacterized lipoprotein YddW (UPF0748 family)